MAVKPIPDGYRTVTPYLTVPHSPRQIDFLKQAFGAQEVERMALPDGRVMHAEVKIGDSIVMMGEANDKWPAMPACLYLYVDDVDATYARALKAGATTLQEPADQFYGDRCGGVKDASGNTWWIATRKEDVSPEELKKRHQAMFAK